MPSKRNVSYHAYNAASPMNNRKLAEFDCLLPVWRRGLVFAMGGWTRVLTSGGELPRWMDTKSFPGWLSQRQWDSVTRQAKGALDSWMELRETEFRRVVNGSSLSPDMKRELYDINRRHEWWKPEDDEAHRMARRIIKHLRKQVPFPRMGRCRTMSMDGKIARVEDAMNAVHYRWWVTVSTLDRGRPIRIPIIADPRLEENLAVNNETLANHLQATHTPEEGWTFHVMTTSPKATPRRTGEIIGVDWGVQSLFATSDGRLLGLGLYAWLSERDVELETLTKELNRSHIPCRESKRYRRLNKRIRDHVTNETNRLLNRLGEQDIGNRRRGTRLPPRRTHPQDEPHRQPCGTQRGQAQTPRPARQQGRHRHQSQPRIHIAGMSELRMHRPAQPQNQRPVPLHLLRIHASCRHQRQPQHTCETFSQGWMAFHRQEANPRHAPQRAR